jgi:hypothetical protein
MLLGEKYSQEKKAPREKNSKEKATRIEELR